uniref:Uncharacterized protein n=1 Tax=viral metagenome TaxID=1070528 RepID=A0A6C0B6L2_9ZZZZ
MAEKKTTEQKKKITYITESNTRKKTNRGDYELEQDLNSRFYDYYSNPSNFFGRPPKTMFPGNGLIGASMTPFDLANNGCDIESLLRGHGTGNMVFREAPIEPDFKKLPSLNIFDSQATYIPDPLVVHRGQRPMFK